MATVESMSVFFLIEVIFSITPTEIDKVGCDGLYVKEIKQHPMQKSDVKNIGSDNPFFVEVDNGGAIPL